MQLLNMYKFEFAILCLKKMKYIPDSHWDCAWWKGWIAGAERKIRAWDVFSGACRVGIVDYYNKSSSPFLLPFDSISLLFLFVRFVLSNATRFVRLTRALHLYLHPLHAYETRRPSSMAK